MAVEVHVTGTIERGRFAEFLAAVDEYCSYRLENGRNIPLVLHGLSGAMNAVRLVYSYPDLGAYEQEEARDAADPEYARVAMAMPFEGAIEYTIYRPVDLSALQRPTGRRSRAQPAGLR